MSISRKRWIIFALMLAWCYFAGAFISLEANPLHWTRGARFALALSPLMALWLAACPLWED